MDGSAIAVAIALSSMFIMSNPSPECPNEDLTQQTARFCAPNVIIEGTEAKRKAGGRHENRNKGSAASNGSHNSQAPHLNFAPLWDAAVVGQKPGNARRLR
jgi:hypothetical protein